MTSGDTTKSPTDLTIEVYTTPGRKFASTAKPEGPGDEPTWSPTSATLIYGEEDAVLVDALALMTRWRLWPIGSRRRAGGCPGSTSPMGTATTGLDSPG